jgi:hypothetical protein
MKSYYLLIFFHAGSPYLKYTNVVSLLALPLLVVGEGKVHVTPEGAVTAVEQSVHHLQTGTNFSLYMYYEYIGDKKGINLTWKGKLILSSLIAKSSENLLTGRRGKGMDQIYIKTPNLNVVFTGV